MELYFSTLWWGMNKAMYMLMLTIMVPWYACALSFRISVFVSKAFLSHMIQTAMVDVCTDDAGPQYRIQINMFAFFQASPQTFVQKGVTDDVKACKAKGLHFEEIISGDDTSSVGSHGKIPAAICFSDAGDGSEISNSDEWDFPDPSILSEEVKESRGLVKIDNPVFGFDQCLNSFGTDEDEFGKCQLRAPRPARIVTNPMYDTECP